jgi:hypothetical protein
MWRELLSTIQCRRSVRSKAAARYDDATRYDSMPALSTMLPLGHGYDARFDAMPALVMIQFEPVTGLV